jgi:putative ABC transport system ATP-binding protein
MPALIEARQVTRVYRGGGLDHPGLAGVSVDIERGEFVALIGQSGSGKSTLLNILAGIDRPDSGAVLFDGRRIDQLSETGMAIYRRHHIGLIFQFFHLIDNLSVLQNITVPAMLAGLTKGEIQSRSEELLTLLGIRDLVRRMPSQLSGGQRQRVAIARALINRPALILADEPTGALDHETGIGVLHLFERLHAGGQAILMVTHDPKVASAAERVLTMKDGRITCEEHRPRIGFGLR